MFFFCLPSLHFMALYPYNPYVTESKTDFGVCICDLFIAEMMKRILINGVIVHMTKKKVVVRAKRLNIAHFDRSSFAY